MASNKAAEFNNHIIAFMIMFVISIVGFIIATPATWSLSTIWGFRNVQEESEKKARSLKGSLIFTGFAFLGLLVGAVIQFIGYMFCIEWTSLNIDILGGFNFEKMFGANGQIKTFIAWIVILGIRTIVTMTFNYLTRKFIIYKAPKTKE
ncbi:MAG: hypothetical protein SPL00_03020 [Bacilli bacterium]|nr:hypothetical protein [Bacilli bacterium]